VPRSTPPRRSPDRGSHRGSGEAPTPTRVLPRRTILHPVIPFWSFRVPSDRRRPTGPSSRVNVCPFHDASSIRTCGVRCRAWRQGLHLGDVLRQIPDDQHVRPSSLSSFPNFDVSALDLGQQFRSLAIADRDGVEDRLLRRPDLGAGFSAPGGTARPASARRTGLLLLPEEESGAMRRTFPSWAARATSSAGRCRGPDPREH